MSKLIANEVNEVKTLTQGMIKAFADNAYENLVYDVQVMVRDEVDSEEEQTRACAHVYQEVANLMDDEKKKMFKNLKRN